MYRLQMRFSVEQSIEDEVCALMKAKAGQCAGQELHQIQRIVLMGRRRIG